MSHILEKAILPIFNTAGGFFLQGTTMKSCSVLASHNTVPAASASLRSEKLREDSSFVEEIELTTEIFNTKEN